MSIKSKTKNVKQLGLIFTTFVLTIAVVFPLNVAMTTDNKPLAANNITSSDIVDGNLQFPFYIDNVGCQIYSDGHISATEQYCDWSGTETIRYTDKNTHKNYRWTPLADIVQYPAIQGLTGENDWTTKVSLSEFITDVVNKRTEEWTIQGNAVTEGEAQEGTNTLVYDKIPIKIHFYNAYYSLDGGGHHIYAQYKIYADNILKYDSSSDEKTKQYCLITSFHLKQDSQSYSMKFTPADMGANGMITPTAQLIFTDYITGDTYNVPSSVYFCEEQSRTETTITYQMKKKNDHKYALFEHLNAQTFVYKPNPYIEEDTSAETQQIKALEQALQEALALQTTQQKEIAALQKEKEAQEKEIKKLLETINSTVTTLSKTDEKDNTTLNSAIEKLNEASESATATTQPSTLDASTQNSSNSSSSSPFSLTSSGSSGSSSTQGNNSRISTSNSSLLDSISSRLSKNNDSEEDDDDEIDSPFDATTEEDETTEPEETPFSLYTAENTVNNTESTEDAQDDNSIVVEPEPVEEVEVSPYATVELVGTIIIVLGAIGVCTLLVLKHKGIIGKPKSFDGVITEDFESDFLNNDFDDIDAVDGIDTLSDTDDDMWDDTQHDDYENDTPNSYDDEYNDNDISDVEEDYSENYDEGYLEDNEAYDGPNSDYELEEEDYNTYAQDNYNADDDVTMDDIYE